MGLEIERKLLVDKDRLGPLAEGEEIRQAFVGYCQVNSLWATIPG
jgi:hypothetical protein